MPAQQWEAVDRFLADLLIPPDPALDAALQASANASLPPISVAPNQGKMLQILARACGARRILEVGTLGGYSTIWLGRALPEGGRLVTLEVDARHAEVARANLEAAGLAGVVEIRVGPALETLPRLKGEEPFDFSFIDADKPSTAEYFAWAVELSRPGSLIFVDNVVREGQVADSSSEDPNVLGMRRFLDRVATEPRVSATVVQTVGVKGYDGFALALVK